MVFNRLKRIRFRARERGSGESIVGTVIAVPLLVMILLTSIDLWSIVAATTRCQDVADAGMRYVIDLSDDYAPMQGTEAYASSSSLVISEADISAFALTNGPLAPNGAVKRVSVSASAAKVGTSSYTVTVWRDLAKSQGTRTVDLSEVEIKASQSVPLSSGILRAIIGNEAQITRTARAQLPLEVVI